MIAFFCGNEVGIALGMAALRLFIGYLRVRKQLIVTLA